MVIVKVCEQINLAEHSNYSKKFDTAKHSFLIFECVKLFSDIALKYAKEKVISRLERQRRIDEACRIDNIAAEFEADQKEFESKKIVSRPGQVAK